MTKINVVYIDNDLVWRELMVRREELGKLGFNLVPYDLTNNRIRDFYPGERIFSEYDSKQLIVVCAGALLNFDDGLSFANMLIDRGIRAAVIDCTENPDRAEVIRRFKKVPVFDRNYYGFKWGEFTNWLKCGAPNFWVAAHIQAKVYSYIIQNEGNTIGIGDILSMMNGHLEYQNLQLSELLVVIYTLAHHDPRIQIQRDTVSLNLPTES